MEWFHEAVGGIPDEDPADKRRQVRVHVQPRGGRVEAPMPASRNRTAVESTVRSARSEINAAANRVGEKIRTHVIDHGWSFVSAKASR